MMTEINTKEGKIKLPCMMPVIVPIEKVMANNYSLSKTTAFVSRL